MRDQVAAPAIVILALVFSPAPQVGQARRTAASLQLPPLSYVCPMAGDEEVIDDEPGSCAKCKMALVPVRLDSKWWCPVHQALAVHDRPGKCRRDGRELVQVTVSTFWSCEDTPDRRNLEPGRCANGSARKIGYEARAHGDHNPRHGGQFFMAADAWHHIEGTYPQDGLFRVFFYDNFTRPFPAKGFTGSVVIRDKRDNEVASVRLAMGRNRTAMEARIPAANAALPLRATLKVKFSASTPEQPFDVQFNEYSTDSPPARLPGGPSAPPTAVANQAAAKPAPAQRVPASPTTPAADAGQSPVTASAAVPASAVGAPQDAAVPFQPPDLRASDVVPMPATLDAALDEEALPKAVPELIAELTKRSGRIDALLNEGNLSELWLPAMGTKTVALALESHAGSLPSAKQSLVTSAVKRVVTSAWDIDAYGDLGNRTKIVEAYQRLVTAVADLKAAYEGPR